MSPKLLRVSLASPSDVQCLSHVVDDVQQQLVADPGLDASIGDDADQDYIEFAVKAWHIGGMWKVWAATSLAFGCSESSTDSLARSESRLSELEPLKKQDAGVDAAVWEPGLEGPSGSSFTGGWPGERPSESRELLRFFARHATSAGVVRISWKKSYRIDDVPFIETMVGVESLNAFVGAIPAEFRRAGGTVDNETVGNAEATIAELGRTYVAIFWNASYGPELVFASELNVDRAWVRSAELGLDEIREIVVEEAQ